MVEIKVHLTNKWSTDSERSQNEHIVSPGQPLFERLIFVKTLFYLTFSGILAVQIVL